MKRTALILSIFIGFGLSAYADDESKGSERGVKPERESASGEARRDAERGKAESRREMPRTEESRGRDAERDRPHPESGRPEAEAWMKKIRHIHEAAENLELAGMNREAGDLRKHAENLERAWHESHRPHGSVGPHRPHGPGDERIVRLEHQLHEMREVIGKLQREIEAIRREVKSGKSD